MNKKIFISVLFFFSLIAAYAKSDKQVQELNQSAITAGTSVTQAKLSIFPTPEPASFQVVSAGALLSAPVGLVKLSCPANAAATGDATVKVAVRYLSVVNDIVQVNTLTKTLKLSFNQTAAKNIDYIRLDGAVQVDVTVTEVSIPASYSGIKLSSEVEAQVYVPLTIRKPADINTAFALTHSAANINTDGTLLVNWTQIDGAESYELEWTYVSDQDGANVGQRLTYDKIQLRDYLFRQNSSRVVVAGNNYHIPLQYEKGLILYRIRAVGKNIVNGKITEVKSLWSSDENFTVVSEFPSANIYVFDGLEGNINWQSSISYAEEGKNKVVVSYHDGTSRNRQAVTKINTDERAVVGETMYDYNGRQQLQVLPVPVKENVTTYQPHFNVPENQTRVEKATYDKGDAGSGCSAIAPKFSTGAGASKYYSPQNDFVDSPVNKGDKLLNKALIPDAKQYPYTQTFYTNDNTGRIAAQSGIGENYFIGSNHETQYLYGAPDQPELTRLFGTQVGYAGHYKKNVVVDPNGQTSVSYLDLDGKVIATALTGNVPDNVTVLDEDKNRAISANLLDNVNYPLGASGDSKEYLNTFTVGETTKFTFAYTGSVGGYTFTCKDKVTGADKTVNLAGVVDVEFKLIDKCKNILIESFATTNYSTSSAASQNISLPISIGAGSPSGEITLNKGEYNIIKRVSLNQDKLEQYWNYYISDPSLKCVVTQEEFITTEKTNIALAGCAVTCEECQQQIQQLLGDASVTYTDEEKYRIEHLCDNLCSDNFKCLSGLNTMLADLSPDGQYGKIRRAKISDVSLNGPDKNNFDQNGVQYSGFGVNLNSTNADGGDADNPDDNDIVPGDFPMSIFNDNNRLKMPGFICSANNRNSWRNPIRIYFNETGGSSTSYTNYVLFDGNKNFKQAIYAEGNYYDLQGNIVYAKLIKTDNNTYQPAVTRPDLVTEVPDAEGIYQIPIKYLSDFKEFYKYWQGHFSNYLVVYHPEFEYFIECTNNQVSNAFERKLLAAASLDDAKAASLVTSTNLPNVLQTDPLLQNDPIALARLTYIYNHYGNTNYSLNQIVNKSIECPAGGDQCSPFSDELCYSQKLSTTEKWTMFVGLYLAERQKYEHEKVTKTAINNGFFNACIGDRNFYSKYDARNWFYRPYNQAPAINVNMCRHNYWWFNNAVEPNCCITLPRNIYSYFNLPVLDFTQTCNWWESGLYADKARRFELTYDMGNTGVSLDESNCTVTIPAAGGQPAYNLEVACLEDVQDYIYKGSRDAEILKYETCGLCPIANDIEQFLIELKKKAVFSNNTDALVTCTKGADFVSLGETFMKQFVPANDGSYPKVIWKGVLSNNGKTLTGIWKTDASANGGQIITRTIVMNIPSGVNKTFNDISFCCLQPAQSTVNGIHAFQMEATYTDATGQVKFFIDGTIDVSLSPCTFNPRCYTTTQADQTAAFLNALLIDFYKSKQLQQSNTTRIALDDDAVRAYYEPTVRSLISKTDVGTDGQYPESFASITPKWLGQRNAAGNLDGELTFTNTSMNSIHVSISPTTTGAIADYNAISRFTNVRPVGLNNCSESTNYCEETSFMADALIVSGTGVRSFVEVTIQVSSLTMSICKPVVFQK